MKAVPPRRPAAPDTNKNKWHAVSILPGDSPCEAALQSRGVRFLAADAPRIPLPECKWAARCRCTYRHHADRRVSLRRIADRGMHGRSVVTERRQQQDRRRADD